MTRKRYTKPAVLSDRALTIPETARRLSVHRATVYRMLDEGELIGCVIRGMRRVLESSVNARLLATPCDTEQQQTS